METELEDIKTPYRRMSSNTSLNNSLDTKDNSSNIKTLKKEMSFNPKNKNDNSTDVKKLKKKCLLILRIINKKNRLTT